VEQKTFGDELWEICRQHFIRIIQLGELGQLAFSSFEKTITAIDEKDSEEFRVHYPIGLNQDGTPLIGDKSYAADDLKRAYTHLSNTELPITLIYHLVTHTEAWFSDLVRAIAAKYPKKIGPKKQIAISTALQATSIQSLRILATDHLVRDLTYKSPQDFAETVTPLFGINLLEIPPYHKFVELKATRDIYVHNRGIANDVYVRKANHFARSKPGELLIVNNQYFLDNYEAVLRLNEAVGDSLLAKWASPLFEQIQREDRESQRPDDTATNTP
jgi:hypothetical protein